MPSSLYSPNVQQVIGLHPSPKLLEMAGRVERRGLLVDFVEEAAEGIPLLTRFQIGVSRSCHHTIFGSGARDLVDIGRHSVSGKREPCPLDQA
jgi:hypothetical protein